MIHQMSVVIELVYDDEDGEYGLPSTRELENTIELALQRRLQSMGFDKEINIEAAHGSLNEAFGIDDGDVIDIDAREVKVKK